MATYRERLIQMKAQRDVWITCWPGYCRKCNATGEITYQDDPSAPGISLSPGTMTFGDPCPACTEKGKCPRCGFEAWTVDDWEPENTDEHAWPVKPRQECGWSYSRYTEKPDEYSCPPEPYGMDDLENPVDNWLEGQYEERTELEE